MTTNRKYNELSTTRRVLIAVASLVAFSLVVSSARAANYSQQNEGTDAEETAREPESAVNVPQNVLGETPWFRFWKAPEESMARWPWGNGAYYPISISSFNEWLQLLEAPKRESTDKDVAQTWVGIPSLRLEASFDGTCLEGRGVFTTSNSARQNDSAALPPPFKTRDFSLAFSFSSNEEVAPIDRLGFYPDAKFYWPTSEKKDRAFRWSRRADINARGDATFDLAFPSSFHTELVLDVPQGFSVATSEGLVREASDASSEDSEDVKRWKIFFGARSGAKIRIFRTKSLLVSSESRTPCYRRETTFDVSQEGLEVVAQFDFDANSPPEIVPTLYFPKPLVPTSFEWNGVDASRHILERTDTTRGTSFKIGVPAVEGDVPRRSLKVVAFCPLAPNFEGALPDVVLESDNFFWRETLCRVQVASPLVASSIIPQDAVQTRDSARADRSDRESFFFKYVKANGEIVLRLRSLKREPKFDSATDCLVLPTEAIAKTTALVDFEETTSRQIKIPVAQDWEIESVLTSAEEPIIWNIQEKSQQDASNSRVLFVSFKKPPVAKQPTRLTISGRLPCSFEKNVEVDRLCPVDLSETLYGAHLISLRSEAQSQVKISSRFGRPFVGRSANPNFVFSESQLRETLVSTPGAVRLYFGEQTVDAVAKLENLRSNYSVGVSCRARLLANRFEEKWNLRFTPSSGARVDSVVFFVSDSTQENAQTNRWFWSTPSEPNKTYEAERLNAPDVVARAPKGAVPYEIKLSTSRTVPFELNVCYSASVSDVVQAPLLFFDEETEKKTSEIVVDSPTSVPFWTESESMTATSAPVVPQGQYESLKRAFRYEASIDSLRSKNVPKLEISFSSFGVRSNPRDVLASSLWCWFENYDSFYESNGFSYERVAYFIENRGSSLFQVTLPSELGVDSLRSVWLDGKRISVSKTKDDDKENVLQIELPAERRFVCVSFECYVKNVRKFGDFRRKPFRFECNAPVLSGSWNAWTSSQYQPLTFRSSRANSYWSRLQDRIISRFVQTKKSTEIADRLATRLGSLETLRSIVETTRSFEQDGANDALTWGDVFGSEQVVEALCASETLKDVADISQGKNDESITSLKNDGARNNLQKDGKKEEKATNEQDGDNEADASKTNKREIRFCIDLVALARIGLTPRTPLRSVKGGDALKRAENLLDSAGLTVLFLKSDFAVLTTYEAASRYNLSSVPLRNCSSVRSVKNEYDSVEAQTRVLNSFGWRFVEPSAWLKADELISPWRENRFDDATPDWERVSLPLCGANKGACFIHRHFLSGLGFFSFIAYVALTWNFKAFSFRFFLGTTGVCLALLCLAPLVLAVVVEGVALGACCLLALCCLQRNDESSNKSAEKRLESNKESADAEEDARDNETTCGFVDLKRLSPEEYALVQGAQTPSPQERSARAPNAPRSGSSSMGTLVCLALICVVFAASGASSRRTDDESTSAGTVQKSEYQKNQDAALVEKTTSGARSSDSDETGDTQRGAWNDPYRVFAPIDKNRRVSGDYYWIESNFYNTIHDALKSRPREKNWRVVDARYEGGLEYDGEGNFLPYNLKITYQICLDESDAVVSLPTVQLAPDIGARFDKQAIAPIYDVQRDEILFEIIDSSPGEHTLELTVALPSFSENEEEISIPILRCPSARVELSVPSDAPTLDIPNALGKTTRSSNRLVAELGPIDRLIVKKGYAPSLDSRSTFNVEQYALARLRPTQTELRALFRCQVSVGKIQRLEIECDPSFAFSGYCKCDVAEIASLEPPSVQDPTLRVVFDKPISGSFTLNADFVARDFSGIGRLQIPRFLCRDARTTRNWLALVPCSDAICSYAPDSNVSVSSFKSAWGAFDETPFAVCDLANTPKDAFVSIRVASGAINLSEIKTYVFRPSYLETKVQARFETDAETFRLTLGVPKSFVVDSIKLFDEQGKALEKPKSLPTDEELTLIFKSPLKGTYSLEIVGRSKTRIDKEDVLPDVAFQNSLALKSFARIYCDENVYVEFTPPTSWNPMDQASFKELGEEPDGSLYRVRAYEIALSSHKNNDVQTAFVDVDESYAQLEPAKASAQEQKDERSSNQTELASDLARFTARANAPKISGVGHIVTYHKYAEDWKASVEFKLTIQNGRVERFFVLLDDVFTIDSPDQNADFNLSETTAPSGARAVMFEPKRLMKDEVVLKFDATFKRGREGLRLPRYVLLPGSEREDVSGVKTYVMLPKRDKSLELSWSTQNMRELTQGSDEWKAAASFSPPSVNSSTAALAKNGNVSSTSNEENAEKTAQDATAKTNDRSVASDSSVMRRVNEDVGMSVDEFYVYERNEGASAVFETEQDQLSVSLARYMFFVNGRRDYFGAVNFLIPPSDLENCVVVAPKDCKILEASVNGSRRLVERLDERRWKVDLDSTKYAKFLEISFQGAGKVDENDQTTFGTKGDEVFDVRFVQIEDVKPEQTIWACAFENTESIGKRWQVFQRNLDKTDNLTSTKEERALSFKEPIAYTDASELLFKLTISRGVELLDAFERDAALVAETRDDDFERLRARWATLWLRFDEELKRFPYLERPQNELTENQRKAVFCVEKGNIIDALNLESSPWVSWNYSRLLEILAQKDKLAENGRFDLSSADVEEFDSSLPRRLWTLDVGSEASLLVGATDENPERVVFAAPRCSDRRRLSSYAACAFILATTAVLLNLLKRESTSRRFRSALFGTLICVWTALFFLFDAKTPGLVGAILLAVGPPIISSIQRRLASRRAERATNSRQNVSEVLDSEATTALIDEDASTETLDFDSDTNGTTIPCEDLNWNDKKKSDSSYDEPLFD